MSTQSLLFELYLDGQNDGFIQEVVKNGLRRMLGITYAWAVSDGDLIGKEFTDGYRWGFLVREMSTPGYAFRVQWFRRNGFASHESYRTLDEAIEEMFSNDGMLADFGSLDRLSKLREWDLGSYELGLIDRVNRGVLKYAEAMTLIANRRNSIAA